MDLAPGALIAGRYRVERKIAEGGMGEVWIGKNGQGARVALKLLLPDSQSDHQIVTRFRREAYLLSRIQSAHVVNVHEFVDDPSFGHVLVMDYIEGESLSAAIKARRMSVEETVELGLDVARAIADLHRASIVHRDIKPDNIILQRLPDGRRRAVLVDFGLSRLLEGDNRQDDEELTGITRADMAVGTIAYMAPEQLLNSREVTPAADIYAVGAILYRAVAGRNVFGDVDDITCARQKLSAEPDPYPLTRLDAPARELQRIILRALKRRPQERYESMEAMLAELGKLREASRVAAMDLDAPTQHASVSSLVGETGEQLDFAATMMARPASGGGLDFAETMHAGGQSLSTIGNAPTVRPPPGVETGHRAPQPSYAANAPRPPQPSYAEAPPPSYAAPRPPQPSYAEVPPPSYAAPRPPQASYPSVGYPPPAQPLASPGPLPASPSLETGISRRAATIAVIVALLGGILLGFVAHATLFDTTDPRCSEHTPTGSSGG